jgi:hypothetical protein
LTISGKKETRCLTLVTGSGFAKSLKTWLTQRHSQRRAMMMVMPRAAMRSHYSECL